MAKNEREERGLRAIDICQDKLDESIENEDSITKILVTRKALDVFVETFEERHGYAPKRNILTDKWE